MSEWAMRASRVYPRSNRCEERDIWVSSGLDSGVGYNRVSQGPAQQLGERRWLGKGSGCVQRALRCAAPGFANAFFSGLWHLVKARRPDKCCCRGFGSSVAFNH